MFIWNWLVGILNYLGFYKKTGKLILLGLENAGKTTLLHMLKENRLTQQSPTLYPTSEELILGNVRLTAFDVGGHKQVRRVWKEYLPIVDAIVFIIDVTDEKFLAESKAEFDSLMLDENIIDCPILILGNKIDKANALGEQEISQIFNLYGLTTGKDVVSRNDLVSRPIELFMCSIKEREGYGEAFRWLSQYL